MAHQILLHAPDSITAGQELNRPPLGEHHLLHRQTALLQGPMVIIQPLAAGESFRHERRLAALQQPLNGALQLMQAVRLDHQNRQTQGLGPAPQLRIAPQLTAQAEHGIGELGFGHHFRR